MASWRHTLLALAVLALGALLSGCTLGVSEAQPDPIDHNVVPRNQSFMTDPTPLNVPVGHGNDFDGLNTIGSPGNGLR
jgi:hypothetical protein